MIVALVVLSALLVLSEVRGYVTAKDCRKRETNFLNRLAAKTYGEYAAFEPSGFIPAPVPQRRIMVDETGLIEVDAEDDDEDV